jgi:hypothetical protein
MMSIGSTATSVPETTRSPAPLQPQQQQQQAPGSSPLPPTAQAQSQQPQFPPGVKLDTQRPPSVLQQQAPQPPQQPQQQQTAQRNGVPSLLSDLVVPFENVKQKGEHVSIDLVFYGKKKCAAMLICACTRAASVGNSGAPHGELGPSTQVARWRVFEHATAAGHREVSVLSFRDTRTENHGD